MEPKADACVDPLVNFVEPVMLGDAPNITGSIQTGHAMGIFFKNTAKPTGAIIIGDVVGNGTPGTVGGNYMTGFALDASKSDSTYKTEFQPSSIRTFAIVKS